MKFGFLGQTLISLLVQTHLPLFCQTLLEISCNSAKSLYALNRVH